MKADEVKLRAQGDVRVGMESVFEGDEGTSVALEEVGLVDLISEKDEMVTVAEAENGVHGRAAEAVADWVAGRDDDHGTSPGAGGSSSGEDALKGVELRFPVIGFGEVILYGMCLVEGQRSSIEWVLRNRDHDTVFGRGDEELEDIGHSS